MAKENNKKTEFQLPIPQENKNDLERTKLYLDLRKELKKNIWWYLSKVAAAVPIATLVVTGLILYNQNRIEEQRFETEIMKQFDATVKNLDSSSRSTQLGAVLALENFINKNENYRSQIYLLLGDRLREAAKDTLRDEHFINQITETLRRVSKVRLANDEAPISLFFSAASLDFLNLNHFDLRHANLGRATLKRSNLSNVNLSNAELIVADLTATNLSNADLSNADLSSAYLDFSDLSNVNLSRTNLYRAMFIGARNLTPEALIRALNWEEARNIDSALIMQAGALSDSLKSTAEK